MEILSHYLLTFSRGSSATRVNQQGLIETVGANDARVDYLDNANGALLLEPQRLNYVTQSETFTGYWGLQGSTLIVDNNAINPSGSSTSYILNSSATGSFKSVFRNESSAWDSKTLTMSCFAKKKTNDFIYFHNIGSASGSPSIYFNIGSGTFGSVGSAWSNAKIENYGNDWYRCSATITFGTATNYLYIANSDGNNNLNSTVGSQTYIWGTQIEEGIASSYIPTKGSAVTRLADSCSNGGNEQVFNDSQGGLYMEFEVIEKTSSSYYIVSVRSSNGSDVLGVGARQGKAFAEMFDGANYISNNSANLIDGKNKIVLTYNSGSSAKLFLNGAKVLDFTGTIPSLSNLSELVQGDRFFSNKYYGNISEIKYQNTLLTDQEAMALTQV